MKKTDMAAMTVLELKALARKKKITLPAGAKKDDVIDAISGVIQSAATAVKAAAKKVVATKETGERKQPKREPASRAAEKPVIAPAKAPEREWKMPAGAEEPLMAQERVAESKYYTGPEEKKSPLPYEYLPSEYGEDRIMIMARDPYMAYSYWEATHGRIEKEKAWFGWDSKLCVRIYDVTGVGSFDGTNAAGYYDQEVYERVGNWYFDLGRPTHSFCADIGLLSPSGRFLTLARSNYITMPRDGVSDVLDEEWMLVDEEFMKLYGVPGKVGGLSSPEVQEMVKLRRMLEITSPGSFSRAKTKRK